MALTVLVGVIIVGVGEVPLSLALPAALTVALSAFLMHLGADVFNFRSLSIPSFTYFVYIGLIFIPSFFVYGEEVEPYRTRYLLAVGSVLITLPLGILLTNALLHFRKKETANWMRRPVLAGLLGQAAIIPFVIATFLLVGLSVLHASEVGNVPILYLLRNPGDYFMLQTLREESLKLLDSPYTYAFAMVRDVFFPFLITVAFARYLQSRTKKWLGIFFAILIFGVGYISMTIEKSPVAILALQLCVLYYLWKSGRVGRSFWVCTLLLFLAFPYFVMRAEAPGLGWSASFVLEAIGYRIFYDPAEVLYYYFEIFPDVIPYLHGGTIGRIRLLLGERPLEIPYLVGSYMDPAAGPWNHANAAFIGNLNADFGLTGVFVGGMLAGAIMAALHVYLVRGRKDALSLAAFSFLMVKFAKLSFSPLPVLLLSDGVMPVILTAAAFRLAEGVLEKPTGEMNARTKMALARSPSPGSRFERLRKRHLPLGR